MVIKKCKICGKEFEARGAAKCCSLECKDINKRNNVRKARKKYQQSDKGKKGYGKAQKKYQQSDKGKKAYGKAQKKYIQNKIDELKEKYDGDLDLILKDCPDMWMVREAIMQVEFGVSYAEAMYEKFNSSSVCEVTGRSDNLVIHHLESFNIHPELGATQNNLVCVNREIHDEFHNIYGRGDNTREQWFEFVENMGFVSRPSVNKIMEV